VLVTAACGGSKPPPKKTRLSAGAVVAALHSAGFRKFTVEPTTDSRVLGTVFLEAPPAGADQVIVDIWALKGTAREAAAQYGAEARTRRVCNVNVHLAPAVKPPNLSAAQRTAYRRAHAHVLADQDAIVAALRERCDG
jgi:hypothetical protein